jgi:hypothetical protein
VLVFRAAPRQPVAVGCALLASLLGGDPPVPGAWLAEAVVVFCLVRSVRDAVG